MPATWPQRSPASPRPAPRPRHRPSRRRPAAKRARRARRRPPKRWPRARPHSPWPRRPRYTPRCPRRRFAPRPASPAGGWWTSNSPPTAATGLPSCHTPATSETHPEHPSERPTVPKQPAVCQNGQAGHNHGFYAPMSQPPARHCMLSPLESSRRRFRPSQLAQIVSGRLHPGGLRALCPSGRDLEMPARACAPSLGPWSAAA
mmetsp:Transcript_160115/g.513711  ORF Transcript_160115/g.513711 Transcript_160115/m.513711 type:complete len:203 (+) Transcript_160115:1683-2291(+)